MLILKLKRNEPVFIEVEGKTVGIMVTGYKEGGYRTAFSAPKEVKITRGSAKNKESNKEVKDEVRV